MLANSEPCLHLGDRRGFVVLAGDDARSLRVVRCRLLEVPPMTFPRSIRLAPLSVAAACTALLACSSSGIAPALVDGKVTLGTWGGDNAGMIVSDTAMHLHIGCTYGDVSGRIMVAADGSFDVAGSYMLRAYPVAVGPTVPARFRGQIDGVIAKVTVTVDDTVQRKTVVLGPVNVKFGVEPRLGPCPICRRPILTRGPP